MCEQIYRYLYIHACFQIYICINIYKGVYIYIYYVDIFKKNSVISMLVAVCSAICDGGYILIVTV